jgi:hypothetical protein
MASAHSLRGLMKWITRHEWRDRFAEVYDAHLQPACERSGVDVDEVVSILGEDFFMTTVWGSAFEDFLTRDFDGGHNIVEDYLKRRGWKESASTRAYITALRTSVASLYEVSDIIKDTSFRARDLVRGGDPILISERRRRAPLSSGTASSRALFRLAHMRRSAGEPNSIWPSPTMYRSRPIALL